MKLSARSRVVVTGLGPVSAIGIGRHSYANALRDGKNGSSPIRAFNTDGFDYSLGCEVPLETEKDSGGRAAQFARRAARLALEDADLQPADIRNKRVVVTVGTTDGESPSIDQISEAYLAGNDVPSSLAKASHPVNLALAIVDDLELSDVEVMTVATACSAGNYAIGNGFDAISCGDADIALVGGADALCRKTFTGFYRLGTVAPDGCRPFDRNRSGILTGEGAAILLLESLDSAIARGAHIYCEVRGYGLTCDAKHPVAPDVGGVAACIQKALRMSGVEAAEVGLVSAHGTGTRANDVTECAAISEVFGDHRPPVVSIKSMIGHSMGAASALGAVASALALEYQFIPPTINFREADPECPVDCVPNHSIGARLEVVQNHGLAFGGNNAVLILAKES